MALSASESELLSQTCTNMNVAAATCREVLEMLRNLGNTGVVDIATHNNAATPHENATNLVHIDSNGIAHLGEKGDVTQWSGYYPAEFRKYSDRQGYSFSLFCNTNGSDSTMHTSAVYCAITDSSDSLLGFDDIGTVLSPGNTFIVEKKRVTAMTSEGSHHMDVDFCLGNNSHQADYSYSCLQLRMLNGTTGVYSYEISTEYIMPWQGMTPSIGTSVHPFDTAYFRTAATVTSDRRGKSNVDGLGAEAFSFVKALRPVSYTVNVGRQTVLEVDEDGKPTRVETTPGTRTHWGFVAQEVKAAMTQTGIEDAAVWCLADKSDPDSGQSLRYEEIIAPLVKAVQVLAAKVEALEGK